MTRKKESKRKAPTRKSIINLFTKQAPSENWSTDRDEGRNVKEKRKEGDHETTAMMGK